MTNDKQYKGSIGYTPKWLFSKPRPYSCQVGQDIDGAFPKKLSFQIKQLLLTFIVLY